MYDGSLINMVFNVILGIEVPSTSIPKSTNNKFVRLVIDKDEKFQNIILKRLNLN